MQYSLSQAQWQLPLTTIPLTNALSKASNELSTSMPTLVNQNPWSLSAFLTMYSATWWGESWAPSPLPHVLPQGVPSPLPWLYTGNTKGTMRPCRNIAVCTVSMWVSIACRGPAGQQDAVACMAEEVDDEVARFILVLQKPHNHCDWLSACIHDKSRPMSLPTTSLSSSTPFWYTICQSIVLRVGDAWVRDSTSAFEVGCVRRGFALLPYPTFSGPTWQPLVVTSHA